MSKANFLADDAKAVHLRSVMLPNKGALTRLICLERIQTLYNERLFYTKMNELGS